MTAQIENAPNVGSLFRLSKISDARQLSEKIDARFENLIPFMAGDLFKMVISDKGYPITGSEYLHQFLNGNIVTFGSRIRN